MTKHRVPEITPEEKAELARIEAEGDPDDIFPTEEDLAGAEPFVEAHPELAASILRERPELGETMERARGRPKLARPKEQVSIRLDPDVLAKLKATGPGWQSRVNEILRKAVG
jgi:uncharacterized protein (DUF4415 family)